MVAVQAVGASDGPGPHALTETALSEFGITILHRANDEHGLWIEAEQVMGPRRYSKWFRVLDVRGEAWMVVGFTDPAAASRDEVRDCVRTAKGGDLVPMEVPFDWDVPTGWHLESSGAQFTLRPPHGVAMLSALSAGADDVPTRGREILRALGFTIDRESHRKDLLGFRPAKSLIVEGRTTEGKRAGFVTFATLDSNPWCFFGVAANLEELQTVQDIVRSIDKND